jgi:ATP/ADP translocase
LESLPKHRIFNYFGSVHEIIKIKTVKIKEFTKKLVPIHRHELPKFLCLFTIIFLKDSVFLSTMRFSGLSIALFFGTIHWAFSRSMKYTMFDFTKEMSFIPLSPDLKTKGGAAAEIMGKGFGKSGGSFVQQTLLITFPSLTLLDFSPFFCGIVIVLMFLWLASVKALNRNMQD